MQTSGFQMKTQLIYYKLFSGFKNDNVEVPITQNFNKYFLIIKMFILRISRGQKLVEKHIK